MLAPAESFVWAEPTVSGARLLDGAVGVALGVDEDGGLDDGLTVGVAAPFPPPFP